MRFSYYLKTDAGGYRESNQDSAYAGGVKTKAGRAFLGVVCDGMGGLSHGEMASKAVTDAFAEWFEQEFRFIMNGGDISEVVFEQWKQLINAVNAEILRLSAELSCTMGTTLSAVLLFCGRYYSAQIGDSRVYMMCGDGIQQITSDHSLVADMAKVGLLTENEIHSSSKRNVLTRCIGAMSSVSADYYSGDISEDSAFLLCSDGFHGGLDCRRISALLGGAPFHKGSLKRRLRAAVNGRIKGGERDNITALMVRVL